MHAEPPAVEMTSKLVGRQPELWLDLALKTAFVALLFVAVVRPDLPQFAGERMEWRAVTYPAILLIVPLGWRLFLRQRHVPYPYALDILLPVPLIVDTAEPKYYETIAWWDELMHFLSWSILVAAFVLLLTPIRLHRATVVALAVGFGAVMAVLWEFVEYVAFIRNSSSIDTAYADTLGDLASGLMASVLAAAVTPMLVRSKETLSTRYASPTPTTNQNVANAASGEV
jgi:hypothetical protein